MMDAIAGMVIGGAEGFFLGILFVLYCWKVERGVVVLKWPWKR